VLWLQAEVQDQAVFPQQSDPVISRQKYGYALLTSLSIFFYMVPYQEKTGSFWARDFIRPDGTGVTNT